MKQTCNKNETFLKQFVNNNEIPLIKPNTCTICIEVNGYITR